MQYDWQVTDQARTNREQKRLTRNGVKTMGTVGEELKGVRRPEAHRFASEPQGDLVEETDVAEEELVEVISIDGMCGVY